MKLFMKSVFKQALFCPASLYYYHDGDRYANQMDEDDFLLALADGGQQVGDPAKAQLRYCELDTMSMVFIWEYFKEMTS